MATINFRELEERARTMSDAALAGALQDILATLPSADALDRVSGTDNGGRYRDEASVYRREQARRAKEAK